MKKYLSIAIILCLLIPISISADAQCYCDSNDDPVWGEATIDGNISDWNLSETYFDVLYRAGKDDGSKPVTAKLYMMFNYTTRTMSVLVLNEPGFETDKSHGLDEFWVKYLNGTKLIDGSYANFAFVPNGWEAKFKYDHCDCYAIKVHTLLKNDDTSANYEVEVFIDCSLPVELSDFTATNTNDGVELNWTTESEIENQGFILERRESDLAMDWVEISSFITNANLEGQGSVTHTSNYQYIDKFVQNGSTYEYRLADLDYDGTITYHSSRQITVDLLSASQIEDFTLKPAYPNPFNPSTIIEYGLVENGFVSISIYDVSGHKVSSLKNEEHKAGWHKVQWNGTNNNGSAMPAGVYLASVVTDNSIRTMKLILVK